MSLPDRPKITLCMIVRDSEEHLPKTLDSVKDEVDEIVIVDTGSKDKTVEIARRYTDKVFFFEWIKDFSAARNFSFSKASNDLILWLDDDDEVINGGPLCDMARAVFSLGATEIWVDYDYTHDRHGNCRTRQRRERFLHRQIYEWRRRVHETPCAKYLASNEYVLREHGYVKHTSMIEDEQDHMARTRRNLEILQDMEKKDELDHAMTFFYANTLRAVGKFDDALLWYRRYASQLQRTTHHYAAIMGMAHCLMLQAKLGEMRTVLLEAISMYPKLCSAYVRMAQTFALEKDWERAIEWADEAIAHLAGQEAELMFDPTDNLVVPHQVRTGALIEQGRFEEAEKEIEIGLKHYPDSEGVLYFKRVIDQNKTRVDDTRSYRTLQGRLLAEGRDEDVTALAEAAPSTIKFLPDVLKYRRRPARGSKPTIGIYCPIALEPWGPKSLETGIGGSETAVIHMSAELVKLGWDVTVYCHTKEIGTAENGVHWTHYLGMNDELDHHDVMITWRDPRAPMIYGQNCKVSVFWAHDVLQEAAWMLEPDLLYDRVMVLSEYHKELYGLRIPEELMWVTQNGTDPTYWAELNPNQPGYLPRQPHKVLYTSCPSRGLIHLLREWSYVVDEVPDAELHIYYGWNKAFEVAAASHPGARRLFVEVEQLKRQNGVTWHGRVGKKELAEAYATSQIFAYPCVTGDTLVDMPRNYTKSPFGVPIKDLVGKSGMLTWTYNDQSDEFELKKICKVWLSRKKAKIIRVRWDDGTSLRCTPEHLVMTYGRGWIKAKDLRIGESVRALKKHTQIQVSAGRGAWPLEHRVIMESVLGRPLGPREHVDHIDNNSLNNDPDNLQVLTASEHMRKTHLGKARPPRALKALKAATRARHAAMSEEQRSENGRKMSRAFWDSMSEEDRDRFVARREPNRIAGYMKWLDSLTPGQRQAHSEKARKAHWNHKVVAIEDAGREDVYDMEVDENHNFIAGGVVVHNCTFEEISCIASMEAQQNGCTPVINNYAALRETVQYGLRDSYDLDDRAEQIRYINTLLRELKHPSFKEQEAMVSWARAKFRWDRVASEWSDHFRELLARSGSEVRRVKPGVIPKRALSLTS